MTAKIINADVLEGLVRLPDQSVQCVVTSPPYWGVVDYGVDGQIGLENSVKNHIQGLVKVFREVRRVLRNDGVVWVNYGDMYATTPNGRRAKDVVNFDQVVFDKPISTIHAHYKPKDLILASSMLAIALQADGWYLRQICVWSKPNARPSGAKDRPSTAHEYIFLLTKSPKYFYDHEAVRVEAAEGDGERGLRSVWEIPTQSYRGAHFATYPEKLVGICIKAGSRQGDTILDPFGGTGTTALVAGNLQRDCILIEINPEYCQMARERVGMFLEVTA